MSYPKDMVIRGLLCRYMLDENGGVNAFDSSLAAAPNHGTYVGSPTWGNGLVAPRAVNLSGSTKRVIAPNVTAINPSLVTVMTWITHPGTGPTFAGIMGRGASLGYQLGLFKNPSTYNLYFAAFVGSYAGSPGSASAVVAANTPSHVAGVFDGSNYKVYVNGAEIVADRTAKSGVITYSGAGSLAIGAQDSGGSSPFVGVANDTRIYGVALTAAEIKTIYLQGLNTPALYIPTSREAA